jgi:hypothetical protein
MVLYNTPLTMAYYAGKTNSGLDQDLVRERPEKGSYREHSESIETGCSLVHNPGELMHGGSHNKYDVTVIRKGRY